MPSPIADTRSIGTRGSTGTLPDYASGLSDYILPKMDMTAPSASGLMGEATQATIANAPNLDKISQIVNQINQQAYLSAPGRQQELANIQRWQAGQLDPSVYADVASQAAQLYGGGGFGVDSPAWQSAVQRAIVTNRQALQEKGAGALEAMYKGMPTTDVSKYTMTPTDLATIQDAQAQRAQAYAAMMQKGALETASLNQQRALAEQEMALKQQDYELRRAAQAAALAAKGYSAGGTKVRSMPSYSDWIKQGYSRPPSYSYY